MSRGGGAAERIWSAAGSQIASETENRRHRRIRRNLFRPTCDDKPGDDEVGGEALG